MYVEVVLVVVVVVVVVMVVVVDFTFVYVNLSYRPLSLTTSSLFLIKTQIIILSEQLVCILSSSNLQAFLCISPSRSTRITRY